MILVKNLFQIIKCVFDSTLSRFKEFLKMYYRFFFIIAYELRRVYIINIMISNVYVYSVMTSRETFR